MAWTTLKGSGVARAWAVLSMIIALLVGFGGIAIAQSSASASPSRARTVEGTWFVQVTLRNCTTNAALGSFNSLVTFARGGRLIESPGSTAFAPGQRSSGHGNWAHQGGHTYSQRVVALILFETAPNFPVSPGFLKGWQTITHTVELSDPDHFTSAGSADFYDSNGQLYRSGCSTAIGTRFE